MKDVTIICPHCCESLVIIKDYLGLTVSCPHCGKSIYIDKNYAESFAPPQQKSNTDTLTEKRVYKCLDCGGLISVDAKVCPHCGKPLSKAIDFVSAFILIVGVLVGVFFLNSSTYVTHQTVGLLISACLFLLAIYLKTK